jgi:DNA-binding NtrC family response regulator
MTLWEMEKGLITSTLGKVDGNRTHAAKILGISVRTLRNKLKEYAEMRRFRGWLFQARKPFCCWSWYEIAFN